MKTAPQIEQGPLVYPVRNAKGIDQADEQADTLAGGMAAVNSISPFYGTTFRISGDGILYPIVYIAI